MRKHITYLLYALIFTVTISCSEQPEIRSLEGYWEIEKVDLPGGNSRDYTISTTLDHYTLETDSTGYKSKVSPRLDGTFLTSGHREFFKIESGEDQLLLHYRDALTPYTEKVIRLKDEQLILVNERDMIYIYKRFKKLELE